MIVLAAGAYQLNTHRRHLLATACHSLSGVSIPLLAKKHARCCAASWCRILRPVGVRASILHLKSYQHTVRRTGLIRDPVGPESCPMPTSRTHGTVRCTPTQSVGHKSFRRHSCGNSRRTGFAGCQRNPSSENSAVKPRNLAHL